MGASIDTAVAIARRVDVGRRGARAAERHAGFVAVGITLLLVAAACAASPPPANQVPNPTRAQVVPTSQDAALAPRRRDVGYGDGADLGCGVGAVSHAPCGGSRTLDIYPHDGSDASKGTIVFVHGGGFTSGDKSDRIGLTGPILHQVHRGWDVVSVNYRLNSDGTAPWPAAIDDVEAAIRWVRIEGAASGVDPSRIVVAGHSAGATIAALAGVAWNTGDPAYASVARVDGWIDIAGIADLTLGSNRLWGWAPFLPWEYLAMARRMSPISHVDAGDPPGYLVHGSGDGVVDVANALALESVADSSGAVVSLDVVDAWADLSWMPDGVRNHLPTGGANVAALDAFLDGI